MLVVGEQAVLAPESGRRAKILAVPRLEANPAVTIRLASRVLDHDGRRVLVEGPSGDREWVDAPGPVLCSLGVGPAEEWPIPAGAGIVDRVAVVVGSEPGPTTVSAAVKAGHDAACRIAAVLVERGTGLVAERRVQGAGGR